MAHSTIYFTNPHSGKLREAPVGFSWTTLFFGFFPALFRGHWAGFLIILFCNIITFGLASLVFPFIYNKMYIKHLVNEGFQATSASSDLGFIQQKLGFQVPIIE